MYQPIYPDPPKGVDDALVAPSRQFKKDVARTSVAIVLFIVLYLVMLAAGLALAFILGYSGLMVITHILNLMAIIFGAGLIGVGVMVSFFLVKFVFASGKKEVLNQVEATEDEYPELFAFVRRVSVETNTRFPEHIYLTSEVNASVSYNSSLRSLILPVGKNLTIGLGLVNMTNLSEFKAVLAHEFGHFSQDSMRAGSYVYQVNKVIYNLLYQNDGYGKVLEKWASIHGAFAFCAQITIKIVQAIQWVLRQAYTQINMSYLNLSRQMEFHADAVAAKSAGSNNLVHALRRLEFADVSYSQTIDKYNQWLKQQYKATNLFTQQRITASFVAEGHKLHLEHDLPVLHDMEKIVITYRRVNIEDQWASHPTRQQREAALNELNIEGVVCHETPWLLFGDRAKELQQHFTDSMYTEASFASPPRELDDETFRKELGTEIEKNCYPVIYKGYYDRRTIALSRRGDVAPQQLPDVLDFYTRNGDNYRKIEALKEDIAVLDQVADKKNGIRYFDIDGEKLHRDQVSSVQQTLKQQLAELEAQLEVNDAMAYAHFYAAASANGEGTEYNALHQELIRTVELTDKVVAASEATLEKIQSAYHETHTVESAERLSATIGFKVKAMKDVLNELMSALPELQSLQSQTPPDEVAAINTLDISYFAGDTFNSPALDDTWHSAVAFFQWAYDLRFYAQKHLVIYQLEYLTPVSLTTQ